MMKKIVIVLILVLLIIVLSGVILNNKNIIDQNDENSIKERFEIIDQDIISNNEMLEVEKINDKYIFIKKTIPVEINNENNSENKEQIYLFDIKQNKFIDKNVNLDGDSQYAGANNKSIYMFLVKRSTQKIELVEISYPNLNINNRISLDDIENIKNIVTAKKSDKFAYSTQEGLFICNKDLTNKQLILKSNQNEIEDFMDLKIRIPLEFVDNDTKIIYKEIGYEWSNGIGIIDIKTGQTNYYEKSDTEFLKYISENYIYTKDVYTGIPVNKYDLKTQAEQEILNMQDTRCLAIDMSVNDDKIVFVKEILDEEKISVEYNVYDINTKQIIATHTEDLIDYNTVLDISFINQDKQILIIKSNEMKIWNYNIK